MFELRYKKKAIKALAKINEPFFTLIMDAIDDLCLNPRPIGCKKLSGRDGYRIRVGDYRILYDVIDQQLIIEIVNIGSRGSIYND
jgi:mRNA interferase RelE/StbE